MEQAGYADVPLVTLGVTAATADNHNGDDNVNHGVLSVPLKVSWRKMAAPLLLTLLYTDTIAKMYYAAAAREKESGQAAELRDRYLRAAADTLINDNGNVNDNDNANNPSTLIPHPLNLPSPGEGSRVGLIQKGRPLLRLIATAAREFNDICQDIPTQRVGIVGEIFLKFNHFAHQHIQEQIMKRGIEIVPPIFTPFFLQEFVNVLRNKQMGLTDKGLPAPFVRLLYALVRRNITRFNRVAAAFRYFIPFDDIRQDARRADGIVSPAAQFGEGWLLPAEVIALAEHGVNNILSLQPFGCIANHIVARGVENAIRRRYPDINLMNLDFDSGVSTVNVTNRLLLFLS